jgi:hypothetical protein
LGDGDYVEEDAVLKTYHYPTRFGFLARCNGRRNPIDPERRSRAIREWIGVAIAIIRLIFDMWTKH